MGATHQNSRINWWVAPTLQIQRQKTPLSAEDDLSLVPAGAPALFARSRERSADGESSAILSFKHVGVLCDRNYFQPRDGCAGVDDRPRQELEHPGGQLLRVGLFHSRQCRLQERGGHLPIVRGELLDQQNGKADVKGSRVPVRQA